MSKTLIMLLIFVLQECLPALCMSSYTASTLQLCLKLVQLKQNSYWLVKVCGTENQIRMSIFLFSINKF